MKLQGSGDCAGRLCGYGAFEGELGCDSGPGSCWEARMLSADESGFHDKALQEATQRISEILDAIPKDKDGRKLSFVHTKEGTILAWVRHGIDMPKGAVTIESEPHELHKALGLRL